MEIGGFQKFSLIDYPGKIAAVIFTQGCNMRCPFCHNRELVIPEYYSQPFSTKDILLFLATRVNQLEGVVVTGGEPTVQKDLIDFLSEIKSMGYLVKLDSNGSNPSVLKKIIQEGIVDFIAMDVKAGLNNYSELTGGWRNDSSILASIDIIKSSGLNHCFRTTCVKTLHSIQDFIQIKKLIGEKEKLFFQQFRANEKILDNELSNDSHYSDEDIRLIDFCING